MNINWKGIPAKDAMTLRWNGYQLSILWVTMWKKEVVTAVLYKGDCRGEVLNRWDLAIGTEIKAEHIVKAKGLANTYIMSSIEAAEDKYRDSRSN